MKYWARCIVGGFATQFMTTHPSSIGICRATRPHDRANECDATQLRSRARNELQLVGTQTPTDLDGRKKIPENSKGSELGLKAAQIFGIHLDDF